MAQPGSAELDGSEEWRRYGDEMTLLRTENARLREAIKRAPCRQNGIPCMWPCESEEPCWKQVALNK